MSKKGGKEPPPPPPPEDTEEEKQWDKVAYNVIFDMLKGLTLGALGTLLIANKKTAMASGIAFGAGQGYADFIQEYKYNEEIREKEKQKAAEETRKKEEADKEKQAKADPKKK